MAKFLKPSIWLPVSLGLIVAGVLAIVGENDDSPGLTLLGIILAISLLFFGVYNIAAESRRSVIAASCFFLLAALGIIHTTVIWFDGELNDSPGVGGLIILISIALAMIGLRFARRRKLSVCVGIAIKLYDKDFSRSGLQFILSPYNDALYVVVSHHRGNFIK